MKYDARKDLIKRAKLALEQETETFKAWVLVNAVQVADTLGVPLGSVETGGLEHAIDKAQDDDHLAQSILAHFKRHDAEARDAHVPGDDPKWQEACQALVAKSAPDATRVHVPLPSPPDAYRVATATCPDTMAQNDVVPEDAPSVVEPSKEVLTSAPVQAIAILPRDVASDYMPALAGERTDKNMSKIETQGMAQWLAGDLSKGASMQAFRRKSGGVMVVLWSADKRKATALDDGLDGGAVERAYCKARTELGLTQEEVTS